jgi:predicted HTH transcriptional regulator
MYEEIEQKIILYLKNNDKCTTRQIKTYLDDNYESIPRSTMWAYLVKLLNKNKIKRRLDSRQRAYWSVM